MSRRGFLLDMDGVVYRGAELIPGADLLIRSLMDNDIPFLFVTNNSQRTRRDVAKRLQRMGIPAQEHHVFTCAMATARFLAWQKPQGTAYVVGEGGLLQALHHNGYAIVDTDPDYVVVGEGRAFTPEILERAVDLVHGGAKLIATNPDPNCPTASGIRPGCGAFVALLEAATGARSFSVGKPSPVMLRMAREQLGLQPEEVVMVGDTMETDVLGGVQAGFRTVLVLTGSTEPEELARYPYQPDIVLDSVADLLDRPELVRLAPLQATDSYGQSGYTYYAA